MDDDAHFFPEILRRTYQFLAFAKSEKAALAGAMINASEVSRIWEQGATFEGKCRPRFKDHDISSRDAVVALARKSSRQSPENFYGGWWFFAFPVEHVRYWPFPFFVRGDDVSFCLKNDFVISTLLGVGVFQDDFVGKQSPLNWYLDTRSHLVHHLTVETLTGSAKVPARMIIWFVLRNLVRFQYASAEAVLLAVDDVLSGPAFFEKHLDLSERRSDLTAVGGSEAWSDPACSFAEIDPPEHTKWGQFFKYSLNGHLFPIQFLSKRHVHVPPDLRADYWPIWGAQEITFWNTETDKTFTTRLSVLRGWKTVFLALVKAAAFAFKYRGLVREYTAAYDTMATEKAWENRHKDNRA